MIHPLAGVLSAYGMGLAALRVTRLDGVGSDVADGGWPALAARAADAARAAPPTQQIPPAAISREHRAPLNSQSEKPPARKARRLTFSTEWLPHTVNKTTTRPRTT